MLGGSIARWLVCWTQAQKARVQIAVATLSDNSLRQTVHTHCASVHQAAKLVAALLRVAGVTAVQAWRKVMAAYCRLMSPAGWLPSTRISSGILRSVIEYGLPLPFTYAVWHSCIKLSVRFVLLYWNVGISARNPLSLVGGSFLG